MQFLLSILIWSAAYIYFLLIGRRQSAHASFMLFAAHAGCGWILLALHCTSIQALGWSITHLNQLELAARPIPEIPETYAIILWMIWIFTSVPALFLVLGLAKGSEFARRWLLRITPILFAISSAEFFRSFRGVDSDSSWVVDALISTAVIFVPYGTAIFFYTRPRIINAIFLGKR